ncbi:helix-turn-helix domain-containing protein [Aquirhabdus sp.]|uniref:helix-turn-helix domain-containing protein n=1 Tax=Aquirhabdus sp. TaxID=2824160 RepID=UPI00396C4A72
METLHDFYHRFALTKNNPESVNLTSFGHFNVFKRDACSFLTPYSRRDYYKISLILGVGELHYANRWIKVDRPALLFSNPMVPYAWETASSDQDGWFCLFTESFISQESRQGFLHESPLFKVDGNPILFLNDEQVYEISTIFKKMNAEIASEYAHKYDMLRSYLHLIVHEALKVNPPTKFEKHGNASSRISHLFFELLERQFPIDSPQYHLKLKTANDFAYGLSVHVNHLNRAVKEATGKTTSEHISRRITDEAKALLQFTNWNISEVAYSLGFEYPAYFTNFFKKNAGLSPKNFREACTA